MPPAKSEVWKYFTRSPGKKNVSCNLCNTKLALHGGTSNMRNHLKFKHPSENNNSAVPETTKQIPLTQFINPSRKNSASNEQITQAIADMIVSDYVPLSIVESDGFLKLMSLVAPDYKVPCRKTIHSRIVHRYENRKTALLEELEPVSSVSITTDTWTSNATESYMTVTEQHIDSKWSMQANVLLTRAMPERHTGENLAQRLKDSVSEFGLDGKVLTCVHDNARNMESAADRCDEWSDLGCFAHTLQLCIKPALELPTVAKTVSKCRKLVGHFKHSTTVTAEMRSRQKLLQEPEHDLIQDVPTRWNSTHLMLRRLSEQRRVITDIMLDTKITKKADGTLLLKDHEWDIVSDIASVLSDFTKVTGYMCTETYVSASEIYPVVCGLLHNSLKPSASDSSLVSKVKTTLRDELQRRFQPSDISTAKTVPIVASLLDIRYKRLNFLNQEQQKTAQDTLDTYLEDVPLRQPSPDAEIQETPAKRPRLDFLTFASPDSECDDELKAYLAEKCRPEENPLQWWRQNESRFPSIAQVAKKLLAVPATSVPSERVFSSAGLLINKLRNRLNPDIVDKIIFLNKN